jgi:hypothetical protein
LENTNNFIDIAGISSIAARRAGYATAHEQARTNADYVNGVCKQRPAPPRTINLSVVAGRYNMLDCAAGALFRQRE